MKQFYVLLVGLCLNSGSKAMFDDDPWLTKIVSEIEYIDQTSSGVFEWDIDAWYGQDLNKFWIKTEGEAMHSEFENAYVELVYSRAVNAFWDSQFGVRRDFKPEYAGQSRDWLSVGYIGTAPYFIDVDARLFIGQESSTQLLIELEREFMLTQRWVLTSQLDISANGSSNEFFREGSGLSEIEFSMHLGYEVTRRIQPFVGITSRQSFGGTKRIEQANSIETNNLSLNAGVHFWF